MSLESEIDSYLKSGATKCWNEFMEEIATEENKDYRRGFKAGLLCAHLHIKSQIHNLITTEHE